MRAVLGWGTDSLTMARSRAISAFNCLTLYHGMAFPEQTAIGSTLLAIADWTA